MATAVANAAKRAVKKVIRTIKVPLEFGKEKGHQIYVYSHLQTNQVIYSLTRHLNNNRSLRQLPFLGKNTVPAALRKDHWTPLCVLSFPKSSQGLDAYARLRAFRELHETAYPLSIVTQTEGKNAGTLMKKKDKAKVLMNQKANTVADMAAVLAIQARPPSPEVVEKMRRLVRTDGRPVAKKGVGSQQTANVFEFQGKIEGTSVWWANTLDAEYAETWPKEVKHGKLAMDRGTAVWPPPLELAHQEMNVEVEEYEAAEPTEEERRMRMRRSNVKRKSLTVDEKKQREAEAQRVLAKKKAVQDKEAAEQTALRAKSFLQTRPESVKQFGQGSEMTIQEKIRDAEIRSGLYQQQQERLRA